MTDRIIRIKRCHDCPSFSHRGAFGRVAYVPLCRATDATLPYKIKGSKVPSAVATGEIPESCPLEALPS